MRFFQYTAQDSSGKQVQGTMQAASEAEVQRILSNQNLFLQQALEIGSNRPGPQAMPRPSAPRPAPPKPQSVAPAPQARPVYPPQQPAPSSSNPQAVNHSRAGTDKQRFFLFSQLAAALRSGINPANAFHEIGQRSAGQFQPSLEEAAQATSHGQAISEVFARWPDLYPEHVVGTIRAGEAGGFLPEAMDEIARQAESAHAFSRWFFWTWFVVVNFLLSLPVAILLNVGFTGFWNKTWNGGGVGPNGEPMTPSQGTSGFLLEMWHQFLWPWGPATGIAYVGLWVFRNYYLSRAAKRQRHRLGLKFPVYGKRARHENLARFAWTMSRVSRAGISPARSWQLAAESVPNLVFRDELAGIGTQLSGAEKMSDIVFRSRMFPDEYAPMVATAEYTGDLSGALDRLSQISAGEFVAAQNYAKARSGCWGALGCFVTMGICAILFFLAETGILKGLLKEIDNTP
ncbi:MAG TPA: type II secretion system F family protein [Fimbriimonas sp.]|nr:type II secretion system F family protein [Fimbriimonas sp.]